MAGIIIHQEKISDKSALEKICPFGAIEVSEDGTVQINSGCRVCKVCVKTGPEGVFEYREEVISAANKKEWQDIAVFAELLPDGKVHPVAFELLGKANELAKKVDYKVALILAGDGVSKNARDFFQYGADRVYIYDDPRLKNFDIERHTAVLDHFIQTYKPSIILVGGTPLGRSLAPRAAARVRTGLTADCTQLDIQDTTDLDQIRPAFGGNVMAHIRTPYNRPQFATVRYKIFSALKPDPDRKGEVIICDLPENMESRCRQISVDEKPKVTSIEDAEVLVVAGRGVKKQQDLDMLKELADLIGAELACTRPLIEAGWMDNRRQIGLSGRTVKPKLLIACGVSGSVQFAAGMKASETIISINTDPEASINQIAHYAIHGDLYEIIPKLIGKLRK